MHLEQWPERIHSGLDQLRERTAGVVGPGDDAVLRRINLLRGRLDDVAEELTGRIDDLAATQAARWDALDATRRRTTWPRRLFWLALGVGLGAAVTYLADPDRGRARRAQMSDQLAARARDLGGDLTNRAKMAVDRVKGVAVETARDVLPEDVPTDPKLLESRIKSEVFGHRDDVTDVVLRVDGPGQVAVKGTVPSPVSERELLAAIAGVEGVVDVRSELSVRTG